MVPAPQLRAGEARLRPFDPVGSIQAQCLSAILVGCLFLDLSWAKEVRKSVVWGVESPSGWRRDASRLMATTSAAVGGIQRPIHILPSFRSRGGGDGNGATIGARPPTSRLLELVSISSNGTITRTQMRKSDLIAKLDCPMRDLRLVDPSFPGTSAAFLARKSAIVVSLDRMRAVIRRNEVLIFDPESRDAAPLIAQLQQLLIARVTGQYYPATTPSWATGPSPAVRAGVGLLSGSSSTATSASLSTGMPALSASAWSAAMVMPFEHAVLEAVLAHVCHAVQEKLQHLAVHILRILGDLRIRYGTLGSFTKLLDELLPLRNRLSELHSNVQDMRKAINDVLMSDEDMAQMYLTSVAETGKARRHDQHQEIELMFENYLMQLEWADTEIKEIQQAIRNTEDTVEIQLDLLRNRILRFELFLNIFSSVMGMGALVTGLFGMNLLSGLEQHPLAFHQVTLAMLLTMLGIFLGAVFYGVRGKLL